MSFVHRPFWLQNKKEKPPSNYEEAVASATTELSSQHKKSAQRQALRTNGHYHYEYYQFFIVGAIWSVAVVACGPDRGQWGKGKKLCLVFARGATAGRFCSIGRLTGGTTFAYGRERKMTGREGEDLTAFIVRVQSKRERDKTSLPTENGASEKLEKKRGKGRQNLKE